MLKHSYFICLLLVLLFFLNPRRGALEEVLRPEKLINLKYEALGETPKKGDKEIGFHLGSWYGYLDQNFKLTALRETPEDSFRPLVINDRFYVLRKQDSQLEIHDREHDRIVSFRQEGIPYIRDNRLFVFSPEENVVSEWTTDGKRKWLYNYGGILTAFDAKNRRSLLGFSDGRIVLLNQNGAIETDRYIRNSKIPVIYGVRLNERGSRMAVLSGLYPQELLLYESRDPVNPVLRSVLKQDVRSEAYLSFFNKGRGLLFESGTGVHYIDIKTGALQEFSPDPRARFVSQGGRRYFYAYQERKKGMIQVFEGLDGLKGALLRMSFPGNDFFFRWKNETLILGVDDQIFGIKIKSL